MQTVYNENGAPLQSAYPGFILGSKQVITATGSSTYTPPATCRMVVIECVAGGGAGGSAVNSTAGQITIGSGGTSGTYSSRARQVNPPYTLAVTVGAAASLSQVADPAALGGQIIVIATAGGTGNALATGTTEAFVQPPNTSGAGATGDVRMAGNTAYCGHRVSGTVAMSGQGAHGPWGGGGASVKSQSAGNAGGNYGAGGSGGMSVNAGGAAAGGAGAQGVVIFWEYY